MEDTLFKVIINDDEQLRGLLESAEYKETVIEIEISENCGNEIKDDLEWSGFKKLEKITVKKNSLQNITALTIADNPSLKVFQTENGNGGFNPGDKRNTGAFYNTKSIIIDGILFDGGVSRSSRAHNIYYRRWVLLESR